ncbi:MAG TPA: hypothetical protein VN737_21795 [Bryobacteraceae bacterium]|nr:hypothetical protein [Bryobacteraceae bacterium]
MGKLFIMPSSAPAGASLQVDRSERWNVDKPPATPAGIDFSAWLSAPRERRSDYFPVYSTVSRAMQTALRHWAREWLRQHPAAFERRITAYSLLVFSCTRPYHGRPKHIFTYDLQQTATLDQAFRTARRSLTEELKLIGDLQQAGGYYDVVSHTSCQVQRFVAGNRRPIYRMFHIETALMDEVLKFTQINIPKLGLDHAVEELRSGFKRNLRRFSDLADFEEHKDDLLRVATEALGFGFDDGATMPIAA